MRLRNPEERVRGAVRCPPLGNACLASDCNMAMFLRDSDDRFAEMNRVADPRTGILGQTGRVPLCAAQLRRFPMSNEHRLMLGIRIDGIDRCGPRPLPFWTRQGCNSPMEASTTVVGFHYGSCRSNF